MSTEVYTQLPRAQNSAPPSQPRRAGELLPEVFRRYVERMAAAHAQPDSLVGEHTEPLGISIVAVPSAGRAVIAPNVSASLHS